MTDKRLSNEDANALSMLIDNLAVNEWMFTEKDPYAERSSALLERVQGHIAALEAELAEAKHWHRVAVETLEERIRATRERDSALASLAQVTKELDRLRKIEEKARAWLEADISFSEMCPDDWVTSRDAYAARESLREALGVKA